jgi:hypothetical protein
MKNVVKLTFITLVITIFFSACQSARVLTHDTLTWGKNYFYVTYVEKSCLVGTLICSRGKPAIIRCNYNEDNTVACVEEKAPFEALSAR